jgi:hypothetical protein
MAGIASGKTLKTSKQVKETISNALATAATAAALGEFRPLNPPPGFARQRFEALSQGCVALWAFRDAEMAAHAKASPAVEKALKKGRKKVQKKLGHDLGQGACTCTKRAVGVSTEAGATMEEIGGLQQILTSRGCLLDLKGNETQLNPERSGPRSRFSGRAAGLAEASSYRGQLLSYAKSRSVTLKRCVDKFPGARPGNPKAGKMAACACRVMEKWRFPTQPDASAGVELPIPVGQHGLALQTRIQADGRVESCGDLVGGGSKTP